MNTSAQINNNYQLPHRLTPRDDIKKVVSEFLKRADELIKIGSLDLAQMEIQKAKEKDPKNIYALALEERISTLRKEMELARSAEEKKTKISSKSSKTEGINPQYQKTSQDNATTSTVAPLAKAKKLTKDQDKVIDRSIELESYKEALIEAWKNGCPSQETQRYLNELRELLEITQTEHESLERSAKHECYKKAILQQLSINPSVLNDPTSMESLQQAFKISREEHENIHTQIINALQRKPREKILVIDDDSRLLQLICEALENNGFEVIALQTSDEAYALLRKFTPDLILCDINLETSTMGGFTFYEKIQEIKHIQGIPFIFLTGLTDETLVRTGKELGVDDYLTKPISEQTLIATIRGKLKRFKQLKNICQLSANT